MSAYVFERMHKEWMIHETMREWMCMTDFLVCAINLKSSRKPLLFSLAELCKNLVVHEQCIFYAVPGLVVQTDRTFTTKNKQSSSLPQSNNCLYLHSRIPLNFSKQDVCIHCFLNEWCIRVSIAHITCISSFAFLSWPQQHKRRKKCCRLNVHSACLM